MTVNRVTLITFGVKNIDRARRYYEAIGWVPEEVMEQVVFYNMNGMKFGFFTLEGLAREQGRPVEELATGAMSLSQNYNSEAEIDEAYQKALNAGAKKITAPTKTEWGGYSGYVADPDGHVWEYAFNPFWPLDQDGHIA
jgi:uncharacterized glyoxalase superfamily protein PhnB